MTRPGPLEHALLTVIVCLPLVLLLAPIAAWMMADDLLRRAR